MQFCLLRLPCNKSMIDPRRFRFKIICLNTVSMFFRKIEIFLTGSVLTFIHQLPILPILLNVYLLHHWKFPVPNDGT